MGERRKIRRQEAVRATSIYRVLDAIKRAAPVSRGALSGLTGLSPSTVFDVVAELQARGLVAPEPIAGAGRGRPKAALKINPDALRLAGAFPSRGELRFIVTDAAGAELHSDGVPLALGVGPVVAEQFAESLAELIARAPPPLRNIHVLGLAFPGTVDTRRGWVHWAGVEISPPLPLGDILSQRLGLPVFLENMVNARARGERLYGDGRDVDDFALVTPTLGLGQYIGGELWTGPRGINPEFRHFKVTLESTPLCDCGATGCLGVVAGPLHLAIAGAHLTGRPAPSFPHFEKPILQLLELAEEAAGDRRVAELFGRAGRALGVALANVVNLHDPARVIVSFMNEPLMEALRGPLVEALKANSFPRGRAPELRLKVEDLTMTARGAVALGLERLITAG